jgi:hypothetical protein
LVRSVPKDLLRRSRLRLSGQHHLEVRSDLSDLLGQYHLEDLSARRSVRSDLKDLSRRSRLRLLGQHHLGGPLRLYYPADLSHL